MGHKRYLGILFLLFFVAGVAKSNVNIGWPGLIGDAVIFKQKGNSYFSHRHNFQAFFLEKKLYDDEYFCRSYSPWGSDLGPQYKKDLGNSPCDENQDCFSDRHAEHVGTSQLKVLHDILPCSLSVTLLYVCSSKWLVVVRTSIRKPFFKSLLLWICRVRKRRDTRDVPMLQPYHSQLRMSTTLLRMLVLLNVAFLL